MKVISIIFLSFFLIILTLFIAAFSGGPAAASGKQETVSSAIGFGAAEARGLDNAFEGRINKSSGLYTEELNSTQSDSGSSLQDKETPSGKNTDSDLSIKENIGDSKDSSDTGIDTQDNSGQGNVTLSSSPDETMDGKIQQTKDETVAATDSTSSDDKTIALKNYKVQKIVYQSNRNGNEDIYSINIDGTGLLRLTDNAGNDLYPEVSPDGKKIAYTADINGTWQIIIMEHDGSNKMQITNNGFRSGYPSWSYDGRYIFFEGFIDGDWEIFRTGSNGTGQVRLTYNSGSHDWHPNGHPNENRVLFESGQTGHESIYIMSHDGSGAMPLFGDGQRRRAADLSASCRLITYTKYFDDNSEVYFMDMAPGVETRVTDNVEWDGHPSFTPDDKYIVFEQNINGTGVMTLYEISTGKKITVTDATSSDSDGSALFAQ
jgi:TolB protein